MEGDPVQRPTTKQPAVRGFTLIELLIVIAIIVFGNDLDPSNVIPSPWEGKCTPWLYGNTYGIPLTWPEIHKRAKLGGLWPYLRTTKLYTCPTQEGIAYPSSLGQQLQPYEDFVQGR